MTEAEQSAAAIYGIRESVIEVGNSTIAHALKDAFLAGAAYRDSVKPSESDGKFPPRVWVKINNDNGELGLDVAPMFSPASRYGLPACDEPYISLAEHEAICAHKHRQMQGEVDRLKHINAKFKVLGTDGCKSCDDGRVTIFVANDECISCNPESYELVTPSEAAEKDKTKRETK